MAGAALGGAGDFFSGADDVGLDGLQEALATSSGKRRDGEGGLNVQG